MDTRFPALLSPIRLGAHVLRNRVVMGSMHTRLDTLDRPVERQAAFYAARARGGVALVITGGVAPNADGRMEEDAAVMATADDAEARRPVVAAVHAAGADALDTGIGWHEAQVPTIAYPVPRAGFAFATRALRAAVGIPVMATNRINTPEVAEGLLADGVADLVSLARPLLADPDFVAKAAAGRADESAPCIACNQACLDHIFSARPATCLVNPRAGREVEDWGARSTGRSVAVVGSGPAGLAAATEAAAAGHAVTLFEAGPEIGGQLRLARAVPGKSEFDGLLAYFRRRLEVTGVTVRLGTRADAGMLAGFDAVILASGVVPRVPAIPGIGHPKVVAYADVLAGRAVAGREVAIIGMGGIAVDVAEFLSGGDEDFLAVWGIDPAIAAPGGLVPARAETPGRRVTLFQRGRGRPGERLGRSTFWIHRLRMRARGVGLVGGVEYVGIDDAGLHYVRDGVAQVHACDTVVVCAGQEPDDGLAAGVACQVVGGARLAGELDALRAIEEGTRAALAL